MVCVIKQFFCANLQCASLTKPEWKVLQKNQNKLKLKGEVETSPKKTESSENRPDQGKINQAKHKTFNLKNIQEANKKWLQMKRHICVCWYGL